MFVFRRSGGFVIYIGDFVVNILEILSKVGFNIGRCIVVGNGCWFGGLEVLKRERLLVF